MANNRELAEFGKFVSVDNTTKNVGIATTVRISAGGLFVGAVQAIRPDGTWGGSTAGIQGAQGTGGVQGTTGTQGTTGAQGTTGTQGITGTQGATGSQGTTGAQGATGTQGTTGAQGTTGTTGTQGTLGTQGTTGTQGTLGTQGISGPVTLDSGTLMLFQQTSAPTGWTKQTTHNNKALRVVSGTASSGGTTAFTTVFASRTPAGTVGDTTLAANQLGNHTHSYTASNSNNVASYGWEGGSGTYQPMNSGTFGATTGGIDGGSGNAHTHGFTGTALDFAVQYVDLIIASKN